MSARSNRQKRSRELVEHEPPPIVSRSGSTKAKRRIATVYDAVAGRIGLNGFLTSEQVASENLLPSKPEEVLLRRVNAPDAVSHEYYHADERLNSRQSLPDSDLLKAIHAYSSEFYTAATEEGGLIDFRSFDETALLALGILLEEATKEAINGGKDMMLLEPEATEDQLPALDIGQKQLLGRVKPRVVQVQQQEAQVRREDDDSDELALEASPRKKRRGIRQLRFAEFSQDR